MQTPQNIKRKDYHALRVILLLLIAIIIMTLICIFVGSSNMSIKDGWNALTLNGTEAYQRIIWKIRIPRVLAAIIAGAGLSVSGLVMQTTLNNSMASPSTLGVSHAAVFGANLSIIAFAGGFVSTGNNVMNYTVGTNPYSTSIMAFLFSTASILLILSLCKIKSFSPNVVVLAGIAVGSLWTAATTILQFYATDVGLSAAVVWSFGDLARATYKTVGIMFVIVTAGIAFFQTMAWPLNALLSGEATAGSMGIHVSRLRFSCLLLASVITAICVSFLGITAICVSFLGIIGFVGIICPHVTKKLIGQDHRFALPLSSLMGSLLLLIADTLSRSIAHGSALPVGAITSLLGAPFFIAIIFSSKEGPAC